MPQANILSANNIVIPIKDKNKKTLEKVYFPLLKNFVIIDIINEGRIINKVITVNEPTKSYDLKISFGIILNIIAELNKL